MQGHVAVHLPVGQGKAHVRRRQGLRAVRHVELGEEPKRQPSRLGVAADLQSGCQDPASFQVRAQRSGERESDLWVGRCFRPYGAGALHLLECIDAGAQIAGQRARQCKRAIEAGERVRRHLQRQGTRGEPLAGEIDVERRADLHAGALRFVSRSPHRGTHGIERDALAGEIQRDAAVEGAVDPHAGDVEFAEGGAQIRYAQTRACRRQPDVATHLEAGLGLRESRLQAHGVDALGMQRTRLEPDVRDGHRRIADPIAPVYGAIAHLDPAQRQRRQGGCCASVALERRRALPVTASRAIALEIHPETADVDGVRFDAPAQQRQWLQIHHQPRESGEIRTRESWWTRDANVRHRDAHARKQVQPHVAVDVKRVAAALPYQRDRLSLEAVGADQHGHHDQDEQHEQRHCTHENGEQLETASHGAYDGDRLRSRTRWHDARRRAPARQDSVPR